MQREYADQAYLISPECDRLAGWAAMSELSMTRSEQSKGIDVAAQMEAKKPGVLVEILEILPCPVRSSWNNNPDCWTNEQIANPALVFEFMPHLLHVVLENTEKTESRYEDQTTFEK
jgi:hypothetical protein